MQRRKPQDSLALFIAELECAICLDFHVSRSVSLENHNVLCITRLLCWTIGCFTKPHNPTTAGLYVRTKRRWKQLGLCETERQGHSGWQEDRDHLSWAADCKKGCVFLQGRSWSQICVCVRSPGMIEQVLQPRQGCGSSAASGRGSGAQILHYGLFHHLWDSLATLSDSLSFHANVSNFAFQVTAATRVSSTSLLPFYQIRHVLLAVLLFISHVYLSQSLILYTPLPFN